MKAIACALALVGLLAAAPASAGPGEFEDLTVRTQFGTRPFKVEVMRTDADRARGMMFRTSLDDGKGMLFEFDSPVSATFWMKDTPLSLDILFVRSDGTVARIAADAEPLSTRVIPAGEPVLGVLELGAGSARRLGIVPGDRIGHAMFAAGAGR